MAKRYCSNCGEPGRGGTQFCGSCGVAFATPASPSSGRGLTPVGHRRRPLIVVLVGLLVVASAATVYWLTRPGDMTPASLHARLEEVEDCQRVTDPVELIGYEYLKAREAELLFCDFAGDDDPEISRLSAVLYSPGGKPEPWPPYSPSNPCGADGGMAVVVEGEDWGLQLFGGSDPAYELSLAPQIAAATGGEITCTATDA